MPNEWQPGESGLTSLRAVSGETNEKQSPAHHARVNQPTDFLSTNAMLTLQGSDFNFVYSLKSESPAINHGYTTITSDERERPRPYDEPNSPDAPAIVATSELSKLLRPSASQQSVIEATTIPPSNDAESALIVNLDGGESPTPQSCEERTMAQA